jgi:hypothetical protein
MVRSIRQTWGRVVGVIRTIDDVIDRMQSIADSTGPRDGVGLFNMVYQRTTEAVRDRFGTGFFADDGFVERLDVVFANWYFAAIDADAAGQRVDGAWRPLFAQRSDRRVHAVQFVVAGMNAHVDHDLGLAVVEICAADHTHPLAGAVSADYFRINDVLVDVESSLRRSLFGDLRRQLAQSFEPLAQLVGSWNLGRARQAAWVRAQVLWELRGTSLFDEIVTVSASAVGMTGRHLLTPLLPPDR